MAISFLNAHNDLFTYALSYVKLCTRKMFFGLILSALAAMSLAGSLSANDEVPVFRYTEVLRPYIHADIQGFLIDDSGRLTLYDIKDLEFADEQDAAVNAIKKNNRRRNVWLKINLKNDGYDAPFWITAYHVSDIRLFLTNGDTTIEWSSGRLNPDKDGTIYSRQYIGDINLPPQSEWVGYLQIAYYARYEYFNRLTFGFVDADYRKAGIQRAQDRSRGFNYFSVFFNGLLIFQFIFISLQWYLVRRVEYFYYLMFITSIFLYFFGRFVLLYSEVPIGFIYSLQFAERLNDILLVLPPFFYYRFGRHFLDMPSKAPALNKRIRMLEFVILGMTVFVALSNAIVPNDMNKSLIVLTIIGIQFVFTLFLLYAVYRVPGILTGFIVIAGVIAISSHMVAMILPFIVSYNTWNFPPAVITMSGIILEIAIFNSGLLFKARQVERDRLSTQEKLLEELKEKQRLQLEYAGVRDKIASDLHDDVGSTLSSIGIYSYAAKAKLSKGDKESAMDLLNTIESNVAETMNTMSDLVWAINPMNDLSEKLIQRIQGFSNPLLTARDMTFDWAIDPDFFKLQLSQLARRNLLLIFKEVINNMVKHAGAGHFSAKLEVNNGDVTITLMDNGKGFDTDAASHGNGLRTIRQRTRELQGELNLQTSSAGTSYQFTFSRDALRG